MLHISENQFDVFIDTLKELTREVKGLKDQLAIANTPVRIITTTGYDQDIDAVAQDPGDL